MPVLEVAGVKIVYEDGYYPRVRSDGSVVILPITPKVGAASGVNTNRADGATAATTIAPTHSDASETRNRANLDPGFPQLATGTTVRQGCHLGSDVWLEEDEQLFCFRRMSSLESGSAEAVAVARGGHLYVDGVAVRPSKGSILQPALRQVQIKIGDLSPTAGGPTSLDAWKYWYVRRQGRYIRVHELRDPAKIARRRRR